MDENALLDAIGQMFEKEREHTRKMINVELEPIKANLAEVKQRVVKIELTQENNIIPNIKLISVGVGGINDRLTKQNTIEAKQEEHYDRIWALEQVVKTK